MANFPEWNSGEIVEDDVGEYLDPRSAAAAKPPPKIRRQGRLPPKKDTSLSASPKALVGFVPNVECDVLDDEFADKGLGALPPELCLNNRELSKASPPHHVVRQLRGLTTSANGSEAVPARWENSPLTTRVTPCAALTTGVSAADRGNRTAVTHQQSSSTVRALNRSWRSDAAPPNGDASRPPPSQPRPTSGFQSNKTAMPLSSGRQQGSKPSNLSKRVFRLPLSGASVASGDGSIASECDGSTREAPPPLSAPAGMNLPRLQNTTSAAKKDTLCKPLSVETPEPLRGKAPSHVLPSYRASGARGPPPMRTDRPVSCGVAAPACSPRTENPNSSRRAPVSSNGAVHGSRVAPNVAAPPSTGPTRTSTAAASGTHATNCSMITRSTSLKRTMVTRKTDPGASSRDYSYGSFFVCERLVEPPSRDSLAGTLVFTRVSSGASLTNYAVPQGPFDLYARGPGTTGSSITVPHVGSGLASEQGDATAHLPTLSVFSGQGQYAMGAATPQHPRAARHSTSAGTMASRTYSFSHKGLVMKPATAGTKPSAAAPTLAKGHNDEEIKKEEEKNDVNASSDFQNASSHYRPMPHKKRPVRRRGTDFEKI
ncbi:hypothetical protein, unknown function [Leishmania tarentolae]|uniref:Uncharacterized protein n=1 Tax=Leishmania tarentolae TaxID=5689 RepID=A0A640KUL0_LEITA|nr:hypothetical protein, unknown function [Leishmania tarentolae]